MGKAKFVVLKNGGKRRDKLCNDNIFKVLRFVCKTRLKKRVTSVITSILN